MKEVQSWSIEKKKQVLYLESKEYVLLFTIKSLCKIQRA